MGTLLALGLITLLLNRFPLSTVAPFVDRRAAADAEGLRVREDGLVGVPWPLVAPRVFPLVFFLQVSMCISSL